MEEPPPPHTNTNPNTNHCGHPLKGPLGRQNKDIVSYHETDLDKAGSVMASSTRKPNPLSISVTLAEGNKSKELQTATDGSLKLRA